VVEASLDVHAPALNRESKVVVKLILVRPFGTRFTNFIDLASGRNMLVHQAANFLERDIVQFPLDPLVRRLCQLELDVSLEIPVTQRVFVRLKSSGISQRGHRTSFDDCRAPLSRVAVYRHYRPEN